MLRTAGGEEYSPRQAIAQKAMLDKLAEDLEEIRERMTQQQVIPQKPLVEFFGRLQYTTEQVRYVRNKITQKGQL